jgi:hypothetical protein
MATLLIPIVFDFQLNLILSSLKSLEFSPIKKFDNKPELIVIP